MPRADAQRNLDALLKAAREVFGRSGVDAPVREIAEQAGVGVGTLYRHFPQRSDLVVAVFRDAVDAAADAAPVLAAQYPPGEAVAQWMQRFVDFIGTKRGLAAALHSGDPAFASLPAYFQSRFQPALKGLLDTAAAAGAMRGDIEPGELLMAAANLAHGDVEQGRRMVALLVDGLRRGEGA
jgi:AcrR family transcriptional regulator